MRQNTVMTNAFLPTLALCGLACAAAAEDAKPSIVVSSPWLRATPKNASVAAGYVTLSNKGTAPDRLLGASLPMAPDGQVHSMSMANGVMRMERLDKGLPIAPGATVSLTPGGYHLMFLKPTAMLKEGETVKGTLTFERAGKVDVTFPVAGFGAKEAPK